MMRESDFPIAWVEAGIETVSGELDRQVPSWRYQIPATARRDGDRVVYAMLEDSWDHSTRSAGTNDHQLARFLRLRQASDAAILSYARKLGVLGLCGHGLPMTHLGTLPRRCTELGKVPEVGLNADAFGDEYWEPFAAWRHYVAQAVALLKVCASLRREKQATENDWSLIFDRFGPVVAWNRPVSFDKTGAVTVEEPLGGDDDPVEPLRDYFEEPEKHVWEVDLATQKECATYVVEAWLRISPPRLRFSWLRGQATLSVAADTLFGLLAMQLALAAAASKGFAVCSACSLPFVPRKRPQPNRRAYCDSCRAAHAPVNDAARDLRLRRKKRREAMEAAAPRLPRAAIPCS